MTGDGQDDWTERPPSPPPPPHSSSRGRHGRASEDYGDPDPYAAPDQYARPYAQGQYEPPDSYAPDQYGPPDPYTPDQYGPPDPYAPDEYGRPDPYAPDQYGRPDPAAPDPLTAPGRFAPPDPLTAPGQYAPPDPLTAPGRYAPPDPRVAPSRPAPPDSHAAPGRPAQPDPLTAPGRYGPPDWSAQTDPYASRPPRAPAADASGARSGPHARAQRRPAPEALTDPSAAGQPGYPAAEFHGRDQNGYGRPESYDPLAVPPGLNGYGRADHYGPPAGQGNGDHDPFRWRPSPETPEPEDLAPLPDYHGGTDHEPEAPPGDWDLSQELGWDVGREPGWNLSQDDSAVGLAEPVSGPPGRGVRQHEAEDWEDAPSGGGLVPGFADAGSRRGGGGRPRRRVSRVIAPLLASVLALVLLVALGVGGYKLYRHFQSPDYSGPGTGEVTVQVPQGATAFSLAPLLVKLGVVASTKSFTSAAEQSSNPDGLEPGFFRLHHHMNSAQAYKLLLNPASRIQSVVAIPEGLRETQILQKLEAKTGTSASAFAAALKDTAALGLPAYANGNPEGYLFPATYNFNPGTSALSMLQTMVARYNQEAASINLPAAAKTAQLTVGQVITVASILEAEAGAPKYYADVAEVIYNRLNQGMFLGLDSTVNYALHRSGVSLTNAQLHVDSPYNTFIHLGLPPGPIDSPGNAAIEAALRPAHGDLLYFVTVNVKTGLTKFATTAAGFQQLENECNQNNSC